MTFGTVSKLALVVVVTVATTGCALALMMPTAPDPRFERDRLGQLTRGMQPDAVRALLGEPDAPGASPATSTWTYEHVGRHRTCNEQLFGVTVVDNATFRQQVVLRFGSAGLESATFTERTRQKTLRADLLGPR